MAKPLFIQSVARALQYQIADIDTVERIAVLLMNQGDKDDTQMIKVDYAFEKRQSFLEGCDSSEVDLSVYDKILEDNDG